MISKQICLMLASLIAGTFASICLTGCAKSQADATMESGSDSEKPLSFERMTALAGAYQDVDEILDLTNEQTKDFKRIYDDHQQKFEHWYGVEGKELAGYQAEAIRKLKNFRLQKFVGPQKNEARTQRIADLHRQQQELESNFETDLLAAIPVDKLSQWKQHRITTLLVDFFEPLELTDAQSQSIAKLAPQALASLNRKQQSNWQGYGTAKLEKLAAQKVLNEQQKAPYEKMAKRKFSRFFKWKNPSQH